MAKRIMKKKVSGNKPIRKKATATRPARQAKGAKPKLLSGGNPQIAKGIGDEPVQAYIAAMPGWKREMGQRLDALITRAVGASAGLRKAVKWNSPLYGLDDEHARHEKQLGTARSSDSTVGSWFLGIHCFEKYIKVAFFRGAALKPVPSGESKQKDVRYLHIHEDGGDGKTHEFNEAQFIDWVKQACRLPGESM